MTVKMNRMALLLVIGLSGCNDGSQWDVSQPAIDQPAIAASQDDQEFATDALAAEDREFVGQEIEQLTSPFTRDTVLKLNSIVRKSLDVIEEFDQVRKQASGGTFNDDEIRHKFAELSKRAASSRADMDLAEKELKSSGEKFNRPIFEAMKRFVVQVDEEIGFELQNIDN